MSVKAEKNPKTRLSDLMRRKEKFGSLGALDFLIDLERNREPDRPSLSQSSQVLETINLEDVSTPLIKNIKFYKRNLPDGSGRLKDLLAQAYDVSMNKGDGEALQSAMERVDDISEYPEINLLRANDALEKGDEKSWLLALSEYLNSHSLAPISLAGDTNEERFFRIHCSPRRRIYNGPKVSVIIPAFNAENTIEFAVKSIFNQSWQNLEIIVVDDVSSDNTLKKLELLAKTDNRLKIIRNHVNSGPYVAKNIGLDEATGDYVTGHDADDWSHPERIEKQISYLWKHKAKAGLSYMLRMTPDGRFSHLGKRTTFSPDGALRKSLVSCMFDTKFLKEHLGYWDCVRFGADSEMVARLEIATDGNVVLMPFCSMLCLDLDTSLTNNPIFGVDKKTGIRQPRVFYKDSWQEWHKTLRKGNTRLSFNEGRALFDAPPEAQVDMSSF